MAARENTSSARARPVAPDDATRERVIRAAISLFAERGFHGTGIRDIAAAADLRSSTLYHYFSNKDDLLMEIMAGEIAPLRDAALRILADHENPASRLATLVETHVWAHASDPLPMLVTDTELRALSGDRRRKVLQLRDEYEGSWKSVIRAGVRQDVFTTAQPDLAARALLQMTTGVAHWFSPGGKLRLEQLCREYADWALAMLQAHEGKRSIRCADLDLQLPSRYLQP